MEDIPSFERFYVLTAAENRTRESAGMSAFLTLVHQYHMPRNRLVDPMAGLHMAALCLLSRVLTLRSEIR
jgi:hypothetical protein